MHQCLLASVLALISFAIGYNTLPISQILAYRTNGVRCQELNRVSKLGEKEVVRFIAQHNVQEFEEPIRDLCQEYIDEFESAWSEFASDPDSFEDLSTCEKLQSASGGSQSIVKRMEQYAAEYVKDQPSRSIFIEEVFDSCRHHLDSAIVYLYPEAPSPDSQSVSNRKTAFCQELDESRAQGKSIAHVIFDAGVLDRTAEIMSHCEDYRNELISAWSMQAFEELPACEQLRVVAEVSEEQQEVLRFMLGSGLDKYADCQYTDIQKLIEEEEIPATQEELLTRRR
ncbi:MAG: hypothetical protein ACFBSG_12165 [Leptolyngbyaceae cyanobacterium]